MQYYRPITPPHLYFARSEQNRKTKEIITPLSQVT